MVHITGFGLVGSYALTQCKLTHETSHILFKWQILIMTQNVYPCNLVWPHKPLPCPTLHRCKRKADSFCFSRIMQPGCSNLNFKTQLTPSIYSTSWPLCCWSGKKCANQPVLGDLVQDPDFPVKQMWQLHTRHPSPIPPPQISDTHSQRPVHETHTQTHVNL